MHREREIYIYILGIPVVFICTLFAGNRPARQVSKGSVVLFLEIRKTNLDTHMLGMKMQHIRRIPAAGCLKKQ